MMEVYRKRVEQQVSPSATLTLKVSGPVDRPKYLRGTNKVGSRPEVHSPAPLEAGRIFNSRWREKGQCSQFQWQLPMNRGKRKESRHRAGVVRQHSAGCDIVPGPFYGDE